MTSIPESLLVDKVGWIPDSPRRSAGRVKYLWRPTWTATLWGCGSDGHLAWLLARSSHKNSLLGATEPSPWDLTTGPDGVTRGVSCCDATGVLLTQRHHCKACPRAYSHCLTSWGGKPNSLLDLSMLKRERRTMGRAVYLINPLFPPPSLQYMILFFSFLLFIFFFLFF